MLKIVRYYLYSVNMDEIEELLNDIDKKTIGYKK